MKIITTHKRAHFDYHISEKIEAGLILSGDEVKSLRNNNASINDAFATVHGDQINLLNCYIGPYTHSYDKSDTTRRTRKLLLHKREIKKLIGLIARKGYTLIPLKLYFNKRGYVKIELGIAKHKNTVDKRKDIQKRDLEREMGRSLKIKF